MFRNGYLKIFFALFIIAFFVEPSFSVSENDPCKETGIVAKNLTFVNLWYKRNGGDCYIWHRNKLLVKRPGENMDIFSDLTCKTNYCKDSLTYDDCKSFDTDRNCRIKMLTGCNLSDM